MSTKMLFCSPIAQTTKFTPFHLREVVLPVELQMADEAVAEISQLDSGTLQSYVAQIEGMKQNLFLIVDL